MPAVEAASCFNSVAHGVGPSVFGVSVLVEWHTDLPGVGMTLFNADEEPCCSPVWSEHMPTNAMGAPALDDAVLRFLEAWHTGVGDGREWQAHVPTLIWELADHGDLEWFRPSVNRRGRPWGER